MIKTLILAVHILTTQYNVEEPRDILTAISYSVTRAECIIDNTNYAACSHVCTMDLNYFGSDWIVNELPICAEVFDNLNIEIEAGGE